MALRTAEHMNAQALRVLAVVRAYARHGQRCPTNLEIATRLGFDSSNTPARMLQRLERMGLVRVQRGQCLRVVEAADGSWRTAGDAGPAHWRDRRRAAAPSQQLGGPVPAEASQPLMGPRSEPSSLNCPAAASVAAGAFCGRGA